MPRPILLARLVAILRTRHGDFSWYHRRFNHADIRGLWEQEPGDFVAFPEVTPFFSNSCRQPSLVPPPISLSR